MSHTIPFGPCEICGHDQWESVYRGPVRDGAFGTFSDGDRSVSQCGRCAVQRLEEQACRPAQIYEGDQYRKLLGEPASAAGFFEQHDLLQLERLSALWPSSLRDRKLADIGCGAGSFLDHVSGLIAEGCAIDPCRAYHESLRERGYHVFATVAEAVEAEVVDVDMAVSFAVIEHIENPAVFLSDIKKMLNPGGHLVVSTPNRKDILNSLLGNRYRSFFYRSVHRWYFDEASLRFCASQAGFEVLETRCVHRFGLANTLLWLRDGRPPGRASLPDLDSPEVDGFWRGHLSSKGLGDYLYMFLRAPDERGGGA